MREKMNSTFVLHIVSLFPSLTSFLAALVVVALHFPPITQSVQWVGGSVVVSNQHSLEAFSYEASQADLGHMDSSIQARYLL